MHHKPGTAGSRPGSPAGRCRAVAAGPAVPAGVSPRQCRLPLSRAGPGRAALHAHQRARRGAWLRIDDRRGRLRARAGHGRAALPADRGGRRVLAGSAGVLAARTRFLPGGGAAAWPPWAPSSSLAPCSWAARARTSARTALALAGGRGGNDHRIRIAGQAARVRVRVRQLRAVHALCGLGQQDRQYRARGCRVRRQAEVPGRAAGAGRDMMSGIDQLGAAMLIARRGHRPVRPRGPPPRALSSPLLLLAGAGVGCAPPSSLRDGPAGDGQAAAGDVRADAGAAPAFATLIGAVVLGQIPRHRNWPASRW